MYDCIYLDLDDTLVKDNPVTGKSEILSSGLEKYNELIGEINLRYYHLLPREKYEEEARKRFLLKVGTNLDLNDPKTLNEKIQWLKFNRDTPMKAKLTDKIAVRDWVREKLGEEYLKKIYGPWDTFDEIDMESLPEPFILKPNHGSAMTMIVKDKNEMDMDAARQKVNKWLATNYAYRGLEMQYEHIKPKVFAEGYYGDKGKDFFEYKIWCNPANNARYRQKDTKPDNRWICSNCKDSACHKCGSDDSCRQSCNCCILILFLFQYLNLCHTIFIMLLQSGKFHFIQDLPVSL